jgi:hypothetical protein
MMATGPDRDELVMVDGRDALAAVILRRGRAGKLEVEALARGISRRDAAAALRMVADGWDPQAP